jgi:hypothetical protein
MDTVDASGCSLLISAIRNDGRRRDANLKVSISDVSGYVGLLALVDRI